MIKIFHNSKRNAKNIHIFGTFLTKSQHILQTPFIPFPDWKSYLFFEIISPWGLAALSLNRYTEYGPVPNMRYGNAGGILLYAAEIPPALSILKTIAEKISGKVQHYLLYAIEVFTVSDEHLSKTVKFLSE